MARATAKDLPDLTALAVPGHEIAVRVTPGAARAGIEPAAAGAPIRIRVTEPPEKGRATMAATGMLARALGLAPSRLALIRGATARDKVFRIL